MMTAVLFPAFLDRSKKLKDENIKTQENNSKLKQKLKVLANFWFCLFKFNKNLLKNGKNVNKMPNLHTKIQNTSKKTLLYWKTCRFLQKLNGTLQKIQNSSKKTWKLKKKPKVSANPLGLLAGPKKAGLYFGQCQHKI